jgi:hypothetical protein
MRSIVSALVVPALVALASVGAACGGDDDPPAAPESSTTSTTEGRSSTTAAPSTTTEAPTTTVLPTTAAPAYQPGDPCALGSDRDCIDPDGTGQGTYLIGGGDCMEGPYPDSCIDLDGDGYAGYPDRG